ncbi:MAG: phenylalanine--tRNA ligase subunit beta [Pseudobdellovibrionaceae bacterium]
MKISLNWVNEYVDISGFKTKPQEIAALLTRAGLEVEEVMDQAQSLKHVVVGKVIKRDKHPNADRLTLCQVQVGKNEILQIVCGAQNHKEGDHVVVAQVGAVLPGDFKIGKNKIRSVDSFGMLCSYKELGMSQASDGIIILNQDTEIGRPIAEVLGQDDVTMELKVTPNRADCLSHYGLAREISCLLDLPIKSLVSDKSNPVSNPVSKDAMPNPFQISIQDDEQCGRYAGCYVQGLSPQESPDWMKKRLEVMGVSSINSIVDVTNYVMLELGQPMHAFDADQVAGKKIIVRPAKVNEEISTLDDKKVKLSGGELLIADSEKALAIAGVIGGKSSAISEQTKNVFFESASFSAHGVRRTARQHGVQTDSAYRFSRGVDPELTQIALQRCLQLILQIHDSKTLRVTAIKQEGLQKYTPLKVKLKMEFLSSKLGYEAKPQHLEKFLRGLACQFESSGGEYVITPPSFRFDLEQPVDFVEEYARLFGFENIPETLPRFDHAPTAMDPVYKNQKEMESVCLGFGFDQAFHFSFADEKTENAHWGLWKKISQLDAHGLGHFSDLENPVSLKNPLSSDMGIMRRMLFSGLFESVRHNLTQTNVTGGLFEIGKVFGKLTEGKYAERSHLSLIQWGMADSFWVQLQKTSVELSPIEKIKQCLRGISDRFQIPKFEIQNFSGPESVPDLFHPYRAGLILVDRKVIGFLGDLHPQLLETQKIRVPVAYMELNFEELQKFFPSQMRVKSISKIPPVQKDIAFIVNKSISVGEIIAEMKKTAGPVMTEVQVFDVFQDEQLGPEKWSLGFRYKLQSPDQTWVDEELLKIQAQIIESLGKKFDCRLR